jgi:hypothetical protein
MVIKSLLVSHVEKSIAQAEELTSKLKPEVLQVQGWSAPKFRHFLNNLCSKADTKYLEIGVWKGATHIAALYKNQIYSIAVDNFSEHWDETGYPVDSGEVDNSELEIFKQNCINHLGSVPTILDMDFLEAQKTLPLNNFNVYFYDGNHSAEDQALALTEFLPNMANEFVFIVDDWNWDGPKIGTEQALLSTGVSITFRQELPAAYPGDVDQWWNGVAIFVLQKKVK